MRPAMKRDCLTKPLELAEAKMLKHAKENLAMESIHSFLEGDSCSYLSSCQINYDISYQVYTTELNFPF